MYLRLGLRIGKTIIGSNGALLLDQLSVMPSAAYSVARRLRSGHALPLIRTRRSSDNAELDIDAVNNELDTTTLLSFCGAGSGFVTTKYDQTGNNRHVTQSSTARQPRIVNAGILDTLNSKPTAKYDGSGDCLDCAISDMGITNSALLSIALRFDGFLAASGVTGFSDFNNRLGWFLTGISALRWNGLSGATGIESTDPGITPLVLNATTVSGNQILRYNEETKVTGTAITTNNPASVFRIGTMLADNILGNTFNGAISEVILSSDTSQNNTITTEQRTYYSI